MLRKILCVGVLGPEAHNSHLYWAQNMSRGLGLSKDRGTPLTSHLCRGLALMNDQVSQGYKGTIKYAKDKDHLGQRKAKV